MVQYWICYIYLIVFTDWLTQSWKLTNWSSFKSHVANYSAYKSQTPKLRTRKSQAHILEALEFRLGVKRDIKIVVWIMLSPQAHTFQQEIHIQNFILSVIKCYFYLHRVRIFLSLLGLQKTAREYVTYTNQ